MMHQTLSAAIVALSLCACSGAMPRDAAQSSYAEQLKAEKNRYYVSLRDGALSRVLAIQPESVLWRELKVVAAEWKKVDAIDEAHALIEHLRASPLPALAVRLDQALRSTVGRRPSPVKTALEAAALKQALLEAFRRLEKEG